MISGLNFISRLLTQSTQEFASSFQGGVVYSITQAVRGDQMVELAKIIASLAVMILSTVVIIGGTRWLFFQNHAREIKPDNDRFQSQFAQVKENSFDDSSSEPPLPVVSPKQPPVLLKQPVLPIVHPLPHYSIDVAVTTHLDLSSVPETLPLSLISDAQKNQLKQKLIDAYHLIQEVDRQLGPSCTFPRRIPDHNVLNMINQLGSFQQDTQNYGFLATQLNNYLEPYYSVYLLSSVHASKQSATQMMQDPIRQLFFKIYQDNLSFVFGASAEKCFNENHFDQCVQFSKKINYNSDLAIELQLAVSRHYINQGQLDQALLILKDCGYKSERDDLKLYIAKTYFNKGNLDQALKIAKDISYSSERDDLKLYIAKTYFNKGNLDQALKIAKDISYSSERDDLKLYIAKTYFNKGNLDQALKTAKDLSYSSERDSLILQTADVYLQQNNCAKAFNIAENMGYSEERDAFILKVARSYYRLGNRQSAIETAKRSTYSSEKAELIKKMEKGLPV